MYYFTRANHINYMIQDCENIFELSSLIENIKTLILILLCKLSVPMTFQVHIAKHIFKQIGMTNKEECESVDGIIPEYNWP